MPESLIALATMQKDRLKAATEAGTTLTEFYSRRDEAFVSDLIINLVVMAHEQDLL